MMADLTVWLCLLFPAWGRVWSATHRPTWDHWAALQRIAADTEIVGPEYTNWDTLGKSGWRMELDWCRNAMLSSVGYPPIADLDRLPTLYQARQLNWWVAGLETTLLRAGSCRSWHREELREDLDRLRHARQVWSLMFQAHGADSTQPLWVCQRRALNDLRSLLGPARYYAGEW